MSDEGAASESVASGHTGRMLALLTVGLATAKLGRYLLPPLLPEMIDALAISPVRAGFVLTAVSLFYGLAQYLGGRYADRLSKKTVLVAAYGFVLVGYLVIGGTVAYGALLFGAVVVGTGMGLYGPADRALVSDLFRRRRGLAFGINVTGTELGGAVGAGLAAVAVATVGWRAAFLVLLPLGLLVVGLLHRWGREPYVRRSVSLDLRDTVARLAGGGYGRVVAAYVLFSFVGQSVVGFLPTLLRAERGFGATAAGLTYASVFVVGFVAKPVGGWASDRTGRLAVAAGAFAVGFVGLALLVVSGSAAAAVLGTVVFAVGHRSFPPVMQAHLMDSFPDDSMGGDLGAIRTVYIGLGSLGPTYVGLVASRADYTTAYAGLSACLVAGVALLLRQRSKA